MPKYSSYKNYSTSTPSVSSHLPSFTSNAPGFLQTVKEGFALGIGSSVGQLMTYSVLGGPKVNVQHTHVNENNNVLNYYINSS